LPRSCNPAELELVLPTNPEHLTFMTPLLLLLLLLLLQQRSIPTASHV